MLKVTDEDKLTMSFLTIYLRDQFLHARQEKDEKRLNELETCFYLLEESAFKAQDRKHGAIFGVLLDSVRDTFMDTEWKSHIPTDSEIEDASR
jgi:hypothetical protein